MRQRYRREENRDYALKVDMGDVTVGVIADGSVYLTGAYGPHGYEREGTTTQTVRRG